MGLVSSEFNIECTYSRTVYMTRRLRQWQSTKTPIHAQILCAWAYTAAEYRLHESNKSRFIKR